MAAAKTELYWLGKGVITIGGKEFGAGVPLPVSEMGGGVLERQKKKGNIGEKIAPVGANDLETVNANLTKELEDSQKANADLTKELEDSQKANADLTKELEDSQKELEEATKPGGK